MSHFVDEWFLNGVLCPGVARDWNYVMRHAKFTEDDVARPIAAREGANGTLNWVLIATLKDGRTGIVIAGCDYSGWDLQDWGNSWVGIGDGWKEAFDWWGTRDIEDALQNWKVEAA